MTCKSADKLTTCTKPLTTESKSRYHKREQQVIILNGLTNTVTVLRRNAWTVNAFAAMV